MATFMQHVYIPLELIDEICSYAEISSQLCLMRTSRQMHAALSYNVYREASVRGFTARQFFATVSCGSSHAQLYASSIRHLTYRGTSLEDTFITFPLFVNALLKMCRLRTLSLSVGKSVSAFLTVQLDKTGINRQCQSLSVSLNPLKKLESCIWALPHLTSLNISGDHRLTSLARCRQLTRLRVGVPISVADLSDVLTNLVDGKGGVNHSLTSLLINFHNATCEETSLAFICIAQMLPSLFDLTLRIPVVNPLMLMDMMTDASIYLHKLRVMLINTQDCAQYYVSDGARYASPEDGCKKNFIRFLKRAGEMRPYLQHVQFGRQEWRRMSALHSWKSTLVEHGHQYYGMPRILKIVYYMNGDSGGWNWAKATQDDLISLLKTSKVASGSDIT